MLREHCVACHQPGGVTPFSLLSYNEVRKRARTMILAMEEDYMPPWPPDSGYVSFKDERRLPDESVKAFRDWMDAGMPEGDSAKAPALPEFREGWRLGEPDLVVRFPEPYTVPAEGGDIFRNFVVPLNLDAPRYVRAVDFQP